MTSHFPTSRPSRAFLLCPACGGYGWVASRDRSKPVHQLDCGTCAATGYCTPEVAGAYRGIFDDRIPEALLAEAGRDLEVPWLLRWEEHDDV